MAERGPRRPRSRPYQRRQDPDVPYGPEGAPSSQAPSAISTSSNAAANLASTPLSVTQVSMSSVPPTPPAKEVFTAEVPSTVRVVVPATVVIASVLIACVLSYFVYRWRKRRAADRKPMLLPQIVIHSDYHTDALPYKPDNALLDDFGAPATGGAHGDLIKGRTPFNATTPIAVMFPSSTSDDDDVKKGSPVTPQVPAAAKRQEGTRRFMSNQFKDHRLSTRTSSLVASQLPSGSPLRISAIVTDSDISAQSEKLVTVVATFQATMKDELPLIMGETLQIVEVYQDQWCLVERPGRSKKQRGVVPLCCVKAK